jgi:hypothetical protein
MFGAVISVAVAHFEVAKEKVCTLSTEMQMNRRSNENRTKEILTLYCATDPGITQGQ